MKLKILEKRLKKLIKNLPITSLKISREEFTQMARNITNKKNI